MKRCLVLFPVLIGSCATVPHANPRFALPAAVQGAWEKSSSGELVQAKEVLDRGVAENPNANLARLVRALIANEEARPVAALSDGVSVLEHAPSVSGPSETLVDEAAMSLVASLLGEAADRALEDRILSLSGRDRSWPSRFVLSMLWDQIARRRGDESLLTGRAKEAGCINGFVRVGRAGRLPVTELLATFTPPAEPRLRLPFSGCRQWLIPVDSLPGVEVVQATIESSGGAHAIALDYAGLAAFRVDGGGWHRHGSTEVHGPTRTAQRMSLSAGKHVVELRLSSHGGAASFSLAAFPLSANAEALDWRAPGNTPTVTGPGSALLDLAIALAAHLEGDVDRILEQAQRLGDTPSSPIVAAVMARLAMVDPSRPPAMVRDRARSLFTRATARAPGFARAWWSLAELEAQDARNRNALRLTERVASMVPDFWPNLLSTQRLASSLSLEKASDAALDAALLAIKSGAHGQGGCAVFETAAVRAERRHRLEEEAEYIKQLAACDATSLQPANWLRQQRRYEEALAANDRVSRLFPAHSWVRDDRVSLLVSAGRIRDAIETLRSDISVFPSDSTKVLRLVDLLSADGDSSAAKSLLRDALKRFPVDAEIRRAVRAMGLDLPLEAHRLDGIKVVGDFASSGRQYQAPAVLILDRTVEQLHPNGSREILTHNIVRVQSKEGIDRWGEVSVPSGSELLRLRTIKADGRVLQPESISGKDTISAPELEIGDYIEWETLELVSPAPAFAPGFVGNRFYFQSPEAPLDRSEYWMLVPAGVELHMDARGGAPAATVESTGVSHRIWKFVARAMPQYFAERASVDAREFIPSVRLSAEVDHNHWIRYLGERLQTSARTTPELRQFARKQFGTLSDPGSAIVRWVGRHIENEGTWDSPASFALARGRGNRSSLIVALGRAVGLRVEPVIARSLNLVAAETLPNIHNFEDYSELLVALPPSGDSRGPWGPGWRHAYPAVRHAGLGYLPAALAGAPAIPVYDGTASGLLPPGTVDDRNIVVEADVAADGSARMEVTETLLGMPSYEWVESLEQLGDDRKKLHREFERGWLAHHFPGASLKRVTVQSDRDAPDRTILRYAFSVPGFAARQGSTLTVRTAFYGSNLGRRFAAEAERKTTLLLTRDVPLTMVVKMRFPSGSRVMDAGLSESVKLPVSGFVFDERRTAAGALGTEGAVVLIERRVRIPIARIAPAAYRRIAPVLRKIDQLESSPIRIGLRSTVGSDEAVTP